MGHILSCDNTTSGLNGKIPVFLKAAIMLLTVILLLYADAINIGKQFLVMTQFGFSWTNL